MKSLLLSRILLVLFLATSNPSFSDTTSGSKSVAPTKAVKTPVAQEAVAAEPRAEERKTASRGYFFGLGPAGLWKLNSPGIAYYVTGGYTFDLHPVAMKIEGEFFGRSGAIGFVGGLGVSYFPDLFNSKDMSPFVGFDMGYGTARVNEGSEVFGQWVPAMVIGPSLGIQFFRNADVNLEIALKWGFFLASGNLGSPSYSLLKLSFHFH